MRLKRDAVYHNQESTARVYGERRHEGRPGWNGVCHWKRSGQNGKIRPGIDGERLYILLEDILYVCCILTKNFQYAGPGRRGMPGAWDIFLLGFRFRVACSNCYIRVMHCGKLWTQARVNGERLWFLCVMHKQHTKLRKNYVHRPGWTGIAYDAWIFTNKQHNEN
jgi:hypothetical protein